MEIAYISADMAESASDSLKAFRVKALSEQVKALRELAKTLTEAEQLSKRDILNFDGPKFQFVLSEIVKLFKKALIQANLTESQSNDVLKLFRDLLALYEPVLRKETDRISSKS
jgi:ribosome-binding ATPase YchF (GTP1/OBG family)